MFPANPSNIPEDSTSQATRSSPGTVSIPTPCSRRGAGAVHAQGRGPAVPGLTPLPRLHGTVPRRARRHPNLSVPLHERARPAGRARPPQGRGPTGTLPRGGGEDSFPPHNGLLPLCSQAGPDSQAPGVSLRIERSTLQGH